RETKDAYEISRYPWVPHPAVFRVRIFPCGTGIPACALRSLERHPINELDCLVLRSDGIPLQPLTGPLSFLSQVVRKYLKSTNMAQWTSGAHSDQWMGRWRRLLPQEFLQWLALPAGLRWLD